MITANQTVILVDVEDQYGNPVGRTVPVVIDYVTEVDRDYGADADGNRGTLLVEHSILECNIDPPYLKDLDSWQVENILETARQMFDRADKHWLC